MKKNDYTLGRPLFIAVAITHCCCCCHSTIIHCYPTIVVVTYRSRRLLILDTEFPPPWPLPLPRPLMPLVVRQQTELLLQLKLLEASATTTGVVRRLRGYNWRTIDFSNRVFMSHGRDKTIRIRSG